jgi:hypothetical protein
VRNPLTLNDSLSVIGSPRSPPALSGGARPLARVREIADHDGVDAPVEFLDPPDIELRQLDRGDLA